MRTFLLSLLLLHAGVCSPAWAKSGPDVFWLEKYGRISWEDEKIRLDNFAIQLMSDPNLVGYYYVRVGSESCRGEAQARAVRAKDYMTKVRHADWSRIIWRDIGYGNEFEVSIWLAPRGTMPAFVPEYQRATPIHVVNNCGVNPLAREHKTADVSQLTLKNVNGRSLRLNNYRGKVVLINFWATWCPPCRAEMPELIRLQRVHAAQGLQIIGINYPPEPKDRVRRFASSVKVNYPIVLGTRKFKDSFTSEDTLPLTVVMNRDGTVTDIISGILLPQEFDEKIKPLLMRKMEGEKRNAKSDH